MAVLSVLCLVLSLLCGCMHRRPSPDGHGSCLSGHADEERNLQLLNDIADKLEAEGNTNAAAYIRPRMVGGSCPRCGLAVQANTHDRSGIWHGADERGQPIGGPAFSAKCPGCGSVLKRYLLHEQCDTITNMNWKIWQP